ncbi:putative glycerol-3-phosphate transporter 5 [Chenopodium quinoa]|uniref:Major facilitator superfamily (MFS) profile domain-containing protein n=1 Tax=Chenopodium quinoa TaxID=63459 RepID=A0A803N6U8_CHEQI|nr:putative glycerol-3-phosphate transporter 5 [Chenopodium quinoa]
MAPNSPPSLGHLLRKSLLFQQTVILTITFFAYASLHASRKPPSIVKSVLGPEISRNGSTPLDDLANSEKGWPPFNGTQGTHRLGELDLAFLSSYAIGMFFSGHFADTLDLRLFLSSGMLLSALFTVAFGFGYWLQIHSFLYFVIVQILCGFSQSTGWPSVVSVVSNWFGKSKRGLIMGVWNSHTSIGNIMGSIVASSMLKFGWGWSFFWAGFFVFLIGILVYLFLAVSPEIIGLSLPSEIELNPIEASDHGEAEHLGLLQSKDSNPLEEAKPLEGEEINSSDAIGFIEAWKLPGVASFAVCLFFSKLVAYTFLYWLPFYIRHTAVAGVHLSHETAGLLSTIFDFGGVLGGVLAGLLSDKLEARAITSVSFLLLSVPALVLYRVYGSSSMFANNILMFLTGSLVNGPYALITTAVAADLGTQTAIRGNSRALATVTAIIDGTGSVGAAIGPVLVGYISTSGWNTVFAMLITSIFIAALSLVPAVKSELTERKSRLQMNETAH